MGQTVGFCINRAVELAQLDSSFLTTARQYYNLSLENVVRGFDLSYFRVQQDDVPLLNGQFSYDLPLDYARSDTCYLVDENDNTVPIIIMSKYKFDRSQNKNFTGDASRAYIDLTNRKIIFNGSPSAPRSYRLTYFRMPDLIDETGANDGDDIDFEVAMWVVYQITAMFFDFSDDARADRMQAKADKILHDYKMDSYDEDNDPTIELGPSYKAGSRPTRGNNGGFFNNF